MSIGSRKKQGGMKLGAALAAGIAEPPAVPDSEIARRKTEHIDIVMSGNAAFEQLSTGFERYRFEHCALPELDLDAVDISTTFLSRRLRAPFIISSMTGGPVLAQRINLTIAEAAGICGIGFAVGSQRIALEGAAAAGFGRDLRRLAGPVPIMANFGAAQLKEWDGPSAGEAAIEMIDADALIIHLNPLQEAVQSGGDRDWSSLFSRIEALARRLSRPVIVKEVGSGISAAVARQLCNAGVSIIDVAGAGGTSWAAVESQRAPGPRERRIAAAFHDWGIPTSEAVASLRTACPGTTIIASGGMRNGIDAAKAIRFGADLVGQAATLLPAALDGTEALIEEIAIQTEQLRIACFCTGSASLATLRSATLLDAATGKATT
jgi:isopentenyl-diphosphate delta-isomerase